MPENFDPKKFKVGHIRAQMLSCVDENSILGPNSHFCYGTLAHYTNLDGLVGIVESGGFWLSDIRFLNDTEEYEHGRLLAMSLIDTLTLKSRFKPFCKVLDIAREMIKVPVQDPIFVACFSSELDSLEQWRAYASGEDGVALVFENQPVANNPFMAEPRMHSSRAIYDDEKKKRLILSALSRYSIEYKKELRIENSRLELEPEIWARSLVATLANAFVTFKHKAFKTESEMRVITHSNQIARMKGKIRHRVRGGRIVPFVNSALFYGDARENCLLPLREVVVGPIAAQTVTIESVRTFLANTGYSNVTVRPSSIPYRG